MLSEAVVDGLKLIKVNAYVYSLHAHDSKTHTFTKATVKQMRNSNSRTMWVWWPESESVHHTVCVWMIERERVCGGDGVTCCLWTNDCNDTDASCFTDRTNDSLLCGWHLTGPRWNKEESWGRELWRTVMYSKINIKTEKVNHKDAESSVCLALRISSLSRALLSQVNLDCQSWPQILQLALCRKALMWKIAEGCNLQGCYPPHSSTSSTSHRPWHTHTHTHWTTDLCLK